MTRSTKALVASIIFAGAASAQALTFALTPNATFSDPTGQALAGFQRAGDRWSSLFRDPFTVRIQIGFENLGSGTIGQAESREVVGFYDQVRSGLSADRTTSRDFTAVASLPGGSTINFLSGGAAPVASNSNGALLTAANVKALGFGLTDDPTFGAFEAKITFNSTLAFDFNPDDGIDSNKFDFVGVATHEIGHALGFISDVDFGGAQFPSTLDFFRFSSGSAFGTTRDLSENSRRKFFSIDNGASNLLNGSFSTGSNTANGADGRQASHWKDDQLTGMKLGIMDPTGGTGELLTITDLDVAALDVIGYDPVPEPGTVLAFAAGLGTLAARRRRRANRR